MLSVEERLLKHCRVSSFIYSLNLAPCYFLSFPSIKITLQGKCVNQTDTRQQSHFRRWQEGSDECVGSKGKYNEENYSSLACRINK